jgi:hypothetical protein
MSDSRGITLEMPPIETRENIIREETLSPYAIDHDTKSLTTFFFTSQNTSFRDQLRAAIRLTLTPYNMLYVGGGAMDYISSFTCSGQIYSSGWTNFANTDDQIQLNTTYDQLEATGAGWMIFSFGMIAFPLGIAREIYRNYRKIKLDSLSYQKKCIDELGYENKRITYNKDFLIDVQETYFKLLSEKKVVNRLAQHKIYKNEAALKQAYQEDEPTKFASLFNGKFALSERNFLFDFLGSDYDLPEPVSKRNWFEKTIVAITLVCKKIWNLLNENALIYWLVWFLFAAVVGFPAATTNLFLAPLIIMITLGIGLIYISPRIVSWVMGFFEKTESITNVRIASKKLDELHRMGKELKFRHYMKVEHDLNERYLLELGIDKPQKRKRRIDLNQPLMILHRSKRKVQKSQLGRYLLEKSYLRMFLAIVTDMVNAIMMTSFVFWLLSAAVFAFVGFMPAFAAFDVHVGVFLSGVFGLRQFFDVRTAQQKFEQTMHEKLCERYKKTRLTKLEYFEKIEKQVEFKKVQVEWLRLQVLLKDVRNDLDFRTISSYLDDTILKFNTLNPNISTKEYKQQYEILSAERLKVENLLRQLGKCPATDIFAGQYDLNKIDVYNHEYREKQRYQAGWWTKAKYLFNRAYTFFGGGQAGSMVAKSVFVSGCVLGGISAGASSMLPIFLGIALSLAVIYAVVCLAQYMVERDRHHREHFVKNMDGNISYFNKKDKELELMSRYLVKQCGDHAVKLPVMSQKPPIIKTPINEPRPKFNAEKTEWPSLVNRHTVLGSKRKKVELQELPSSEARIQFIK